MSAEAVWTPATPADAPALADLRKTVSADLAARFGPGPWGGGCTERGVRADFRHATVFVVRGPSGLLATSRLARRKPWAIDPAYFTPVRSVLHVTALAVSPARQRHGLGRSAPAHAVAAARAAGAGALRLDAYDHAAGAGEFYLRCGFQPRGHVVYRGTPLCYFECLL